MKPDANIFIAAVMLLSLLASVLRIGQSDAVSANQIALASLTAGGALLANQNGLLDWTPENLTILTAAILLLLFRRQGAPGKCTAPGYTQSSVLGCYKVYAQQTTNTQARATCAADGGRLLLVNNQAENDALIPLITQAGGTYFWVQGKKDPGGAAYYLDDDGNQIPYNNLPPPVLPPLETNVLYASGQWSAVSLPDYNAMFVCEIL